MNETELKHERECMKMRINEQRREIDRLRMNLDAAAAAMEEARLLQIIKRQGVEIERLKGDK